MCQENAENCTLTPGEHGKVSFFFEFFHTWGFLAKAASTIFFVAHTKQISIATKMCLFSADACLGFWLFVSSLLILRNYSV